MAQYPSLKFAESLRLTSTGPNIFTNAHEPWTWPNSTTIPGGLLMSQCALAASHTVSSQFTICSLHAHFLAGASAKKPLQYRVVRLSDGGRFVVRSVTLEQGGREMLHATVTFMHNSPWTGVAMTHSVRRRTRHAVSEITMDDLEDGRGSLGSFMRFQRLPLVLAKSPESGVTGGIASSVAQIIPRITGEDDTPQTHILGLINLSDYHVMDAPLQLNGITFGLPKIGDKNGPATQQHMKMGTTLNHTVHFHGTTGWRADDLTYIEVSTSWGRDGRAMVKSEIFDRAGGLIATCTQESFYVLKKDVVINADSGSKL